MTGQADTRPTFASLKAGLDIRAGGRIVAFAADAFSTGFPELDCALGGGFPRGTLGTLEGPASSGRTGILASMLAKATRTGLAAVIDDGTLYPPDLERAGVDLVRLLVTQAHSALQAARCADALLRSRAFNMVAMPAVPLRAPVWSRLCGLAQKSNALLIALALESGSELTYFASTRVRCAIGRVLWSGRSGVLCELAGYDINAHVLKHRRAAPGAIARLRIADERIAHVALRSRADVPPVRGASRERGAAGSACG